MKKLICIPFLAMFAVLSATSVYAQSGVNNNSDWHVPPQVPTIPQAPAVTVVAPVVTPLDLTVTPVAAIGGGAVNLAPTLLAMPVMPPVPTAAAIAAAAPTVAAPTAAQIAAAPAGGANAGGAAAGGANAQVAVVNVQPIPTLPPVPPVPPIPDLQLTL